MERHPPPPSIWGARQRWYLRKVSWQEVGRGVVSKTKGVFLGQLLFGGAGTGRGLISQITSLVLGRKFQVGWFKIPSWEGPQLLRLVPEFRFHDRA